VPCPPLEDRPDRYARWGEQLDVRNITTGEDPAEELSAEQVAGYIAKYATKATESFGAGLDHRLTDAEDLERLDRLPAHVAELVRACWELGGRPELEGLRLRAWAHMLGFRGHWSTKSRRYSTTMTVLRRARVAFAKRRRARDGIPLDAWDRPEDDQAVIVVASWVYVGSGYATEGERWLARAAEMRHVSILQLHALAEAVPGRYQALVLVAGYGGLRWGELVGLRRRRVDLAGARIHVVEQLAEVAGKFIVSPPKTAAGQRVVVLPAVAVAALADHLDDYAAPGPDGLVFPSGRGTYLQRSNFSRLVWRPAVQQLGLDGLRFHDLRHTAATLAAAAGATTKELMERMGHTSPAVALRYQHVMADRQGAIAAALDGLVREAENGNRPAGRARRGHDGPRRGSGRRAAGG
jgi:integrase